MWTGQSCGTGEGHSLSQRHNKLAFVSRSTRFLEQHVGLPGLPEGCAVPEGKAASTEQPGPKKVGADKGPPERAGATQGRGPADKAGKKKRAD